MSDPCKAREPQVINNALIERCIDRQYPKGELGRLARQEGIPMEEIEEIRFEYMYILKIDHLWVLKSLTNLSLNNNLIEKIENLDTLIHLRELNMSFNKIAKIENLEALCNLEKVSFYDNLIEIVEGMNTHKKLRVFSIGKNRITDRTNVYYFRRFEKLTSLNMAGNPCTEIPKFRNYVGLFVPQIVYYEYQKIATEEREEGMQLFESELKELEKVEAVEKEIRDAIEKERSDAELHARSFVEYLNSKKLFDTMYENDEEGKALLEMDDDVTELYDEYVQQFTELCQQIFEAGQRQHEIRQAEIDAFEKSIEAAKQSNQNNGVGFMEKFLDEKAVIYQQVKKLLALVDADELSLAQYDEKLDEIEKVFNEEVHRTWKALMGLELDLFEQMEEVIQMFEQTMTEMINNLIEEAQGIFTQVRAAEVTYTEALSDISYRYQTTANLNPDMEIPDSLKLMMLDRDAVGNALASTHDIHMQIIDGREDVLIHRAKEWLENLMLQLTKEEIKRNRYKLLEISHFLDIQKEEFEKTVTIEKVLQPIDETMLFA